MLSLPPLIDLSNILSQNSTFTFDAQFNYTQNATLEFSPGEYFPKEVALTRTTTATGATFTPTPVSSATSAAAYGIPLLHTPATLGLNSLNPLRSLLT